MNNTGSQRAIEPCADIKGIPVQKGAQVAFAAIGTGSNHGGMLRTGKVEHVDFDERYGLWELHIRDPETRKISKRASYNTVVIG